MANRLMELAGFVELTGEADRQVATLRSQGAPGAAFRQIGIQDNQAPNRSKERIQYVKADRKRVIPSPSYS
ncbi:hypothetical protein JQ614_33790 [Bradyrhizobium diazoefficiens]|nr:hypothetical protein [Bradyrhizobium diazoefficiens]MBR0922882.1 hypothetical protein [Bradyrhizobium diazoefficiens]